MISIHAAREGGDRNPKKQPQEAAISIHAAREGGDELRYRLFYVFWISIHAAREGGDDDFVPLEFKRIAFQSTPPVKAATKLVILKRSVAGISIHAAREGGDGVSRCIFLLPDNFNPRRP